MTVFTKENHLQGRDIITACKVNIRRCRDAGMPEDGVFESAAGILIAAAVAPESRDAAQAALAALLGIVFEDSPQ